MALIQVTVKAEGFGEQVTSWNVADILVKPYATFLVAWINKGLVVASDAVAEAAGDEDKAAMNVLGAASK